MTPEQRFTAARGALQVWIRLWSGAAAKCVHRRAGCFVPGVGPDKPCRPVVCDRRRVVAQELRAEPVRARPVGIAKGRAQQLAPTPVSIGPQVVRRELGDHAGSRRRPRSLPRPSPVIGARPPGCGPGTGLPIRRSARCPAQGERSPRRRPSRRRSSGRRCRPGPLKGAKERRLHRSGRWAGLCLRCR